MSPCRHILPPRTAVRQVGHGASGRAAPGAHQGGGDRLPAYGLALLSQQDHALVRASGSRRAWPVLPPARTAGRASEGMTGAMGCDLMAASPEGEAATGWPVRAASPRVRAMSGLGEISPVWVSEGGSVPA